MDWCSNCVKLSKKMKELEDSLEWQKKHNEKMTGALKAQAEVMIDIREENEKLKDEID